MHNHKPYGAVYSTYNDYGYDEPSEMAITGAVDADAVGFAAARVLHGLVEVVSVRQVLKSDLGRDATPMFEITAQLHSDPREFYVNERVERERKFTLERETVRLTSELAGARLRVEVLERENSLLNAYKNAHELIT